MKLAERERIALDELMPAAPARARRLRERMLARRILRFEAARPWAADRRGSSGKSKDPGDISTLRFSDFEITTDLRAEVFVDLAMAGHAARLLSRAIHVDRMVATFS